MVVADLHYSRVSFSSSLGPKKSRTFLLKETSKFSTSTFLKKRPNEVLCPKQNIKHLYLHLCQGAKKSLKIHYRFRFEPYSCSEVGIFYFTMVLLHI